LFEKPVNLLAAPMQASGFGCCRIPVRKDSDKDSDKVHDEVSDKDSDKDFDKVWVQVFPPQSKIENRKSKIPLLRNVRN
jgi:hypothetical protein